MRTRESISDLTEGWPSTPDADSDLVRLVSWLLRAEALEIGCSGGRKTRRVLMNVSGADVHTVSAVRRPYAAPVLSPRLGEEVRYWPRLSRDAVGVETLGVVRLAAFERCQLNNDRQKPDAGYDVHFRASEEPSQAVRLSRAHGKT